MAKKRILPLGFIDRTTKDGAIIMLTRPSDSHTLRPETPVTLRSRSVEKPQAAARVRGLITSVGYVTATFKIVETHLNSKWPEHEEVLRRGIPVYQALTDSFVPDPARTLSEEQTKDLQNLAARYRDLTRPRGPRTDARRESLRNGTSSTHNLDEYPSF